MVEDEILTDVANAVKDDNKDYFLYLHIELSRIDLLIDQHNKSLFKEMMRSIRFCRDMRGGPDTSMIFGDIGSLVEIMSKYKNLLGYKVWKSKLRSDKIGMLGI